MAGDNMRLFRRTLVVALGVGVAVILWRLSDLVLILFAAMLVGLMFHQFAEVLKRRLKLPFPFALMLAVLLPVSAAVLIAWAFGSLMLNEFTLLFDYLPEALEQAESWLERSAPWHWVKPNIEGMLPSGESIVAIVQRLVGGAGTVVTVLVVVIVAGVYLAAQPGMYHMEVLGLLPPRVRPRVQEVTTAVIKNLNGWLKGQALSMAFVALGTGLGLWAIGLPSPLAIALVAGLCEFVPYAGVVFVAIPATILGFSISVPTGMLTILVLVIIQQVQGNFVTPMLQSAIVNLPPAVTIFAMIAAGMLMGPLGVILAVPLTVVGLTLVRELAYYETPPVLKPEP